MIEHDGGLGNCWSTEEFRGMDRVDQIVKQRERLLEGSPGGPAAFGLSGCWDSWTACK